MCVCVCVNVSSGAGEIVSEDRIRLNEWTTVVAERDRNDGSLIVDDAPAVKGTTPDHPPTRLLSLRCILLRLHIGWVYYICQVNGVKLADILLSLLCACVCVCVHSVESST